MAHTTLHCIEEMLKHAESNGITTELVYVFDRASDSTREIVKRYPIMNNKTTMIEVNNGDLGLSRNDGVAASCGEYITILDGDDYYSFNWITQSLHCARIFGNQAILHPEYVISFGTHNVYHRQINQVEEYYDPAGLLLSNYWAAWTFAHSSVYKNIPYQKTSVSETGYGYEDWHWNCETIAHGYEHQLASGVVGYYRRKEQSLMISQIKSAAIIGPTKLFSSSMSKLFCKESGV